MGNTYGNVTLRGVDAERVSRGAGRLRAVRVPLADGDRVAVFMPEADEDPLDAAGNLSVALGCTALGVFVFDSDLLVTWLVVNGEISDRYVSDARLVAEIEAPDEPAEPAGEWTPGGPRTVVYFVGPGGHGLISPAPPGRVRAPRSRPPASRSDAGIAVGARRRVRPGRARRSTRSRPAAVGRAGDVGDGVERGVGARRRVPPRPGGAGRRRNRAATPRRTTRPPATRPATRGGPRVATRPHCARRSAAIPAPSSGSCATGRRTATPRSTPSPCTRRWRPRSGSPRRRSASGSAISRRASSWARATRPGSCAWASGRRAPGRGAP